MQTIYMGPSPLRNTFYAHMSGRCNASRWVALTRAPLWLASCLYHAAVIGHRTLYRYGLRRQKRLPCSVISIGNLTLGGTGKTLLTIWMARWLHQNGWRVAVLSRGYGAHSKAHMQVVSSGDGPLVDWQTAGDEPYLLAQVLPGIPILIGKDRYHSGRYACAQFGTQVVILDDGFQHHALHRDLDVLLIDASNPFGQHALIPRGILREPLRAIQRADAIVCTRTETPGISFSALHHQISQWRDTQPIYAMRTAVEGVQQNKTCLADGIARIRGHRLIAFAGIGNPQAFATTLKRLGCTVAAVVAFPDHHPYTSADWHAIVKLAQQHRADALITTAKDAVRLAAEWHAGMPLYVLQVGVCLTSDSAPMQQQLKAILATTNMQQSV